MSKKSVASVGFSGFIGENVLNALNKALRADHKLATLDGKRKAVKDTKPVEYEYSDGYDAISWVLEYEETTNEKSLALDEFRKCAKYVRTEIIFGESRDVNVQAFDAMDIECRNGILCKDTVLPVVVSMKLAGKLDTTKDKDWNKAVNVSADIARRVNATLAGFRHKGKAYKSTKNGVKATAMIGHGKVNMTDVFYAEIVTFYRELSESTKGKACHFESDGSLWVKESNIVK